ncbi:DUF3021 domain-containing protein [Actinomyces respiraculi]|uniref:DUF3021 domain-containing protein n=1 Tax=Actinomyces respiraculi TaxID=2744574 RepID=UPI001422B867|nr:DUF3021 domain-containing protein [Actinomyces respiraculi]
MTTTHILKRTGTGALGGITIGSLTTLAFSAAHSTHYTPGVPEFLVGFANENVAVLVQLVVYALLGAVCMLASEVYRSDRLNMSTASLVHLVLVGGGVAAAGWYLQWFSGPTALRFGVVFILVYAVIWVASYLRYRHVVNAVNARLSTR